MKGKIARNPYTPKLLKFTAHGYKKMVSTSKTMNKIATRKNFTLKRPRAFDSGTMPHS